MQFENLILNNLSPGALGIDSGEVRNLGPFFQTQTKHRILHLIEFKTGSIIDGQVAAEVKEKNRRLAVPRGFSMRNHLVYLLQGNVRDCVTVQDYFDKIVWFEELCGV